ncbi:transcriptional regulator, TetR family [Janthinobacterium sp. Marseille]|uniref:TetR/AcrR family transcriptional regulator n=1 Tax=Herminiimonas aquatilis TaxID=345342 RepID=A0ABW2J8S3_9BURK|nr:TetR/AcrR family transcriptional regulator [Janthinobacterium sp. Marseille]ABR91557.1 transcriptional regulator, TetR family [Janthinobacterium sp. Marseille]
MPSTIPSTTKSNIVLLAKRLIKTRSYLGFSFQDIANEIGLKKASLHHHFPSKEMLGVEIIQEMRSSFDDWSESISIVPEKKLDAYFKKFRDAVKVGEEMCPAGGLASAWSCVGEEMRFAARDLRSAHIMFLTNAIAGINRQRTKKATNELASYVFSACQGGLISSRMTGRAEEFDLVIKHLRSTIYA